MHLSKRKKTLLTMLMFSGVTTIISGCATNTNDFAYQESRDDIVCAKLMARGFECDVNSLQFSYGRDILPEFSQQLLHISDRWEVIEQELEDTRKGH